MIRRGNFDASQAFHDAWESRTRGQVPEAEVRDLVAAAELICRSAVAAPSDDFRASLRERLMAEADTVLVADPTPQRPVRVASPARPRRRRLAIATAALVGSVGVVGTLASSASAVPGDVLYPVKRSVENVQIAFHRDDSSRGEYRLQQARERLAEAQLLDSRGDTERLAATLDDFTEQADSGTGDLFEAYASDQSTDDIEKVNDFVADASLTLAGLSSSVPADARDSFDSATRLVSGIASQASDLCTACGTADVSSLARTVQGLVGNGDVATTDDDTTADAPAPVTGVQPSTSAPIKPGSAVTTPPPVVRTPGTLGGALEGTVDGLVGEDGLVPNLLGGLLGTK